MYEVIIYEDKNGKSEIRDFLKRLHLQSSTNKDAKINMNKIYSYINALERIGTRIGNPTVKHIDGELWELRPLKNRIFFFYWKDNKFVLVHHFVKKTPKTPKREIEKAKGNIRDFKERFGE